MVQYASTETKIAYMSGEFAVSYATRLFGAEAVASLATISRGKRKGAIKGVLSWTKCTVGGWQRNGYSGGGVVYPGFVNATIEVDGKIVMETRYPTHEKKLAREAEEAKLRAVYERSMLGEDIAIYEEKAEELASAYKTFSGLDVPVFLATLVADIAENDERLAKARAKLAALRIEHAEFAA